MKKSNLKYRRGTYLFDKRKAVATPSKVLKENERRTGTAWILLVMARKGSADTPASFPKLVHVIHQVSRLPMKKKDVPRASCNIAQAKQ